MFLLLGIMNLPQISAGSTRACLVDGSVVD